MCHNQIQQSGLFCENFEFGHIYFGYDKRNAHAKYCVKLLTQHIMNTQSTRENMLHLTAIQRKVDVNNRQDRHQTSPSRTTTSIHFQKRFITARATAGMVLRHTVSRQTVYLRLREKVSEHADPAAE